LDQTYSSVEVIVVNDGSTDSSMGVISVFNDRVMVIDQDNMGASGARNSGIAVSNGTYLAFLDADDYWAPDFLEKMVDALEQSDSGIAYCGWQNVGLENGRGSPFVPPDYESDPDKLELLIENTRWPIHAVLVKRDLITEIGGFDRKWATCEDFALWIEIATCTTLARVPEVLAFYRHHDKGQLTDNRLTMARNHWLVQMEFIKNHPEITRAIDKGKLKKIIYSQLLRCGYSLYWDRELESAREIFVIVMKAGYGSLKDWLYMLPSIFPVSLHSGLIRLFGR
jgi:glycosyltransferase involved in cell wall biosynthesis